jgi:uncharacterized membrane protein
VAALLLAMAAHALTVWALPRLIMQRVFAGLEPGVTLPPPTDHEQRRVVMPSPDLLYALCRLDLGDRGARISADPKTPHYWSVALYAANSDNFHVINDRQLHGRPLDLVVLPPGTPAAPGAVVAPTRRVLLLMRLLIADPAHEMPMLEAARRSLRCEAI